MQEGVEAKGFGPWSMKADVLHVQPTAEVLEHMLSVRLHLDNCGEENGALRVLSGSYLHGRIPEEEIPAMRETPEVVCAVNVGGALLGRVMGDERSPAYLAQSDRFRTTLVQQFFSSSNEPFPCRACLCNQHQEQCLRSG